MSQFHGNSETRYSVVIKHKRHSECISIGLGVVSTRSSVSEASGISRRGNGGGGQYAERENSSSLSTVAGIS